MPDQAEGLRQMVAELDDDGTTHEPISPDYERAIKAALWDRVKAELETESRGGNNSGNTPYLAAFRETPASVVARAMLTKMELAESFERVRAGMGR